MPEPLIANSEASLQSALGELRTAWQQHKYLRITYKTGKSRSKKQNSHSHAWYGQLERELPEDDAAGWKCFCKLHFAVPIMRAEDPEFRDTYDEKLKPLPYETKLWLLQWLPVTSLMSKSQLKKYEVKMQDHFATKGVVLTYRKDGEEETEAGE